LTQSGHEGGPLGYANGIKPGLKCDFLLAPDVALGTRKSSWNRVWRSTVERVHALHVGRIVPILQKRKAANFGSLKVWFEEDPSPKNNLEKHVGMVWFFDLDQTVAARMY
jgi:hypothetical protein